MRMRKRIQETFQVLTVFLLLGLGLEWLLSNNGNPPAGRTGSPGDGGATCAGCHSGGTTFGPSLSLTGFPASYSPGTAYSLTLTLGGTSPEGGFEITAERTSDNAKCNTMSCAWTANTGGDPSIDLDGTNRWLGHNVASSVGPHSWTFSWTAPASASCANGTIVFYAAGNASDNTGGTGGDQIVTNSWSVPAGCPQISGISPDFGSASLSITLSGSNFGTTPSTVSFGVTFAACPTWGGASITCTVPSGAAGAVSVTVQNSTGTSNGVTFTRTGTPTVSTVSPLNGSSTDTARTVSLTGNQFSPGATVQLTKTGQTTLTATGVTVPSLTSISAAIFDLSGAATGQWNVVVTNPDGLSGTLANGFLIQKLPAQPTGFAPVVPSSTSIQWNWTDSASNEDGYRLVDGADAAVTADLPVNTGTFTETTLTPNQQVTRKAQAFNVIGTSNSVAVTTFTHAAVPGSVAASSVQVSSAALTWTANGSGPGVSYEAQISTDGFGTVNFTSVTSLTSVVFGTTGAGPALQPNTTYQMQVRALNGSAIPVPTAFIAVSVVRTLPVSPGAASPVFASVNVGSITFNWTAGSNPNAGVLTYNTQVSTDNFATVNFTSATALLSAVFGAGGAGSALQPNANYFFRAQAVNGTGAGAFGVVASTFTQAAVPGSVAAADVQVGSTTLSWTPNGNGSGVTYVAQISTDGFAALNFSSTTALTSMVFGAGGAGPALQPNTTYQMQVQALNSAGVPTSFVSVSPVRTLPVGPGAGSPVFPSVQAGSITFQWTAGANPNPSILTYDVQISTDNFSTLNLTSTTALSSAVFGAGGAGSVLLPNTTYYFRARAANATGPGAFGAVSSTFTLAAQPTGLAVTGRTSNSISFSWNAAGNPTGTPFEVSMSTDGFLLNFSTPVPITAGLTAQTTAVAGLVLDTTYYFRVRARNWSFLFSPFSSTVSTKTLSFPTPPSSFTGLAVSSGSIQWSWQDNSGDETGFRVHSTTGGQVSPDLAANTTFWVQPNLTPGTSVQNFVVAFAPGAESPASNTAQAFTAAASADVPAASPVSFTVSGATVSIPVGALHVSQAGTVAGSTDPVNQPVVPGTPQDIANADSRLGNLKRVPGTARQFLAFVGGVRKTDNFNSAVTVTLSYADQDGDDVVDGTSLRVDTLRVYTLQEGTADWTELPGQGLSKTARAVSASASHFSLFALVGTSAASNLSNVRVFPNPFKPNSGHAEVRFRNMPADSVLRLYTIAGELVRQLKADAGGEARWDGKNSAGMGAASGVYVVVVEAAGERRRLKVGVER